MTPMKVLGRRPVPLWLRVIIAIITISTLVVITQDVQIFPGAVAALFEERSRDPSTLPVGVESIFVTTADNERLEMWRYGVEGSPGAALIFHGNAGDVAGFFGYQQFFNTLGVTSYGFDYRGFGKSTGWPSEEGLYADGRAAAAYVLAREKIPASALTIVGISIGSGPAVRLARELSPSTLLLITPYTSLPDVIATVPLFGLLSPFSLYQFPVAKEVQELRAECAIVVHGERDEVIPYVQGRAVFEAMRLVQKPAFVSVPMAGHNDAFFVGAGEIARRLSLCAAAKH